MSADKGIEKRFLLGNEAIVQGALEADIRFVTSYPGTPSSEIANTFAKIHKENNIYFEFSVNEKVAVELSAAVALSGLRAMAIMKHVGVNVASDALVTLAYVGVKGGFVLISADDPSCHSSQNEQDNRLYANLFNIPMLEPSTAQEAKEMTKFAFQLSEQCQLPVMVRTTTRLSHLRSIVEVGEKKSLPQQAEFLKDPRYIERQQAHSRLLERMEKGKSITESCQWNHEIDHTNGKPSTLGFLTSGVSFGYTMDIIEDHDISANIFKVGMSHPLPEKKISEFLAKHKKVVVVEELEPFLEDQTYRLAKEVNPSLEIIGKRSRHFPLDKEYSTDLIINALERDIDQIKASETKHATELPPRYPTMCPGCSHRNTYFAVKRVLGDHAIYASDIGCYALGIIPPVKLGDIWLCMSGGIGLAGGFGHANQEPVVAFIGDSTFLHSGIPALLNAVYNQHNFILIILDNSITAMTGHQPNPASEKADSIRENPPIDLEALIRTLGVKHTRVVNPQKISETVKALKELKQQTGIRVLIARQPCIVNIFKRKNEIPKTKKYRVSQDLCTQCAICIDDYACPAFELDDERRIQINEVLCIGCGDCVQVCPVHAIGMK